MITGIRPYARYHATSDRAYSDRSPVGNAPDWLGNLNRLCRFYMHVYMPYKVPVYIMPSTLRTALRRDLRVAVD